MNHKLWYDPEMQVIHLKFEGDYLTSDIEHIREGLIKLVDGIPYRQMCIHINSSKVENRETREKSNDLLKDFNITHVSFIGGSAANRMIAKVMLKTGTLKTKGDFFKAEEEGIKWLLSNR